MTTEQRNWRLKAQTHGDHGAEWPTAKLTYRLPGAQCKRQNATSSRFFRQACGLSKSMFFVKIKMNGLLPLVKLTWFVCKARL
jgi:hypothetical protein